MVPEEKSRKQDIKIEIAIEEIKLRIANQPHFISKNDENNIQSIERIFFPCVTVDVSTLNNVLVHIERKAEAAKALLADI